MSCQTSPRSVLALEIYYIIVLQNAMIFNGYYDLFVKDADNHIENRFINL